MRQDVFTLAITNECVAKEIATAKPVIITRKDDARKWQYPQKRGIDLIAFTG